MGEYFCKKPPESVYFKETQEYIDQYANICATIAEAFEILKNLRFFKYLRLLITNFSFGCRSPHPANPLSKN